MVLSMVMDGIDKSHLELVACEDEEKNGDEDIGEEEQNDDDIDEEEEKDDDDDDDQEGEEGDGEEDEDEEEGINDDDQGKDDEEEEEKANILKRGSNMDLKRKRYEFRNIAMKKPKREIIVRIKNQKNNKKPGIKNNTSRARFNEEAIILRNPKDRWSAKRYKMAEENLLSVMISNEATADRPILRPQLRAEARKKIGDTGLLDHLLKHMAGKIGPESDKRFRQRHNTDGAMEYWLENADLVNIRRDAGVTDPYWVPPPGWKPGESPTQDPICARELKDLKDGFSKMERDFMAKQKQLEDEVGKLRREMNEIAASKRSQEDVNNQAFTVVGSKTNHSDISQRLDQLAKSLCSSICDLGSAHVPVERYKEQSDFVKEIEEKLEQSTARNEEPLLMVPKETGSKQQQVQKAFIGPTTEKIPSESGKDIQALNVAAEKAAKIERIKSGFRICKPQGTSNQLSVQPPLFHSSSSNSPVLTNLRENLEEQSETTILCVKREEPSTKILVVADGLVTKLRDGGVSEHDTNIKNGIFQKIEVVEKRFLMVSSKCKCHTEILKEQIKKFAKDNPLISIKELADKTQNFVEGYAWLNVEAGDTKCNGKIALIANSVIECVGFKREVRPNKVCTYITGCGGGLALEKFEELIAKEEKDFLKTATDVAVFKLMSISVLHAISLSPASGGFVSQGIAEEKGARVTNDRNRHHTIDLLARFKDNIDMKDTLVCICDFSTYDKIHEFRTSWVTTPTPPGFKRMWIAGRYDNSIVWIFHIVPNEFQHPVETEPPAGELEKMKFYLATEKLLSKIGKEHFTHPKPNIW